MRQQTLRATIGWSYDLLDAPTRTLFAQLGVFAGGFTLAVAEEVCGPAALDGIQALADQSLLSRNGAGVLAAEQGDFAAARAHFDESLELARARGARHDESRASSNLGVLAVYAGDDAEAIRRYEHAAAIARELGDERTLALLLQNLGLVHAGLGHRERAVALHEEGLVAAAPLGDPALVQSLQRGLARLLIDEERVEATLRSAVGSDVFTDAVAEGAALPQADAVALALS